METNRIYLAFIGWLIGSLALTHGISAQEAEVDSSRQNLIGAADSSYIKIPQILGDSTYIAQDTSRRSYLAPDTMAAMIHVTEAETLQQSVYETREYLSQGAADEVKGVPGIIVMTPGPALSPAIPVEYLNVSGVQISVNGLPFYFNSIYRPYVIGTDLNRIPWEILNEIRWDGAGLGMEGIDFRLGKPYNRSDRSDVEVARGPYGYSGSRWRFQRPFGQKTFAYFTVGFNKSRGYIEDSDYDGYHVTGGISRKVKRGEISVDWWKHRAKTGLNSFDFLAPQVSRQSLGIDRGEIRYEAGLHQPYYLSVAGYYQRSAQTISGYTNPIKSNYDIGGGRATLSDSAAHHIADATLQFHRQLLFGVAGRRPKVDQLDGILELTGRRNAPGYSLKLDYSWNGIDHAIFLPSAKISYDIGRYFSPYMMAARSRRYPDLYLLYFEDDVQGLGISGLLESYHFHGAPELASPVISEASFGISTLFPHFESATGITFKKVASQTELSINDDSNGNFDVFPSSFDDKYIEVFGRAKSAWGPFSGEFNGTFRTWSKRYFGDQLEKGPKALGFGRISFLRQFFIPRLYFGGSLEARASARREYRSLASGSTDGIVALFGRLEFRYEDFTFWFNEDNLTNVSYITWWPYYRQPRSIWWGFRWTFVD